MSVILICRKIIEVNLKPKLCTLGSGFKMHTVSRPKVLLLKNKKPDISINRSIFQWFRKPKKGQLKIIDNIPDQYELIFRNTMERYIFYSQLGTTITSVVIVLFLIVMYGSPKDQIFYGNKESLAQKQSYQEEYMLVYVTVFFTAVVLLQLVITKLPFRIYYLSQQKKYIFILPSSLPNQTRKIVCKVGEVKKLPTEGILPWKDARYLIKKDFSVIMVEENFRKPADLYIMMGVQRDPNEVN